LDNRQRDNRQIILDEALRLFAARGYEAVGVADVVAAAGLTKPSLYHHFGSKLGLLQALLEASYLELLARVRPAAEYHGDLPLTLFRVVSAYCAFALARPQAYRFQLNLCFAPPESEAFRAVTPWNQRQHDVLKDMFQAAAHDHGNMKGRHALYAVLFLGMINTLIGVSLSGHLALDDEVVFKAVHQYMHGIYS
jgi:TetR/AcrR family transcriptional regulator